MVRRFVIIFSNISNLTASKGMPVLLRHAEAKNWSKTIQWSSTRIRKQQCMLSTILVVSSTDNDMLFSVAGFQPSTERKLNIGISWLGLIDSCVLPYYGSSSILILLSTFLKFFLLCNTPVVD
ncbi:IN2-1 protein [Corchorus olitorius]|uniref:IN2-1 protein n=1 Tax=Corchorus olitorius TaxID=93759 RepID=A0A1R3H4N1_9ROSI|nr:IN2-1 protein [Corchorus olitorius]